MLKVDQGSSFLSKTVYLQAKTKSSGLTVTRAINVEVCGSELIDVDPLKNIEQSKSWVLSTSEDYKTFPQFDPLSAFNTGSSLCKIASLKIFEKTDNSYTEYKPTGDLAEVIKFSDDFKSILVRTNTAFSKKLYITGVTASGNYGVKNPGSNGGLIVITLAVVSPPVVIIPEPVVNVAP